MLATEGGLIISVENAAASTAYGFEAEFVANPTPALTISGNIGLQRTEFDTFTAIDQSTLLPIDYSGNEFPQAPEFSSLAVEHAWPLSGAGELRVSTASRPRSAPASSGRSSRSAARLRAR